MLELIPRRAGPAANLYNELKRVDATRHPEKLAEVEARLDSLNPYLETPIPECVELVTHVLNAAALTGKDRTSTCIQLRLWLEVLEGRKSIEAFQQLKVVHWTWQQMAALDLEPLVAFLYRRMLKDFLLRVESTPTLHAVEPTVA